MNEIYIISADDEVIRELKKATFLGKVNICDKDDLRHGILYSLGKEDAFSILVAEEKVNELPVDRFVSSLCMDYIPQIYGHLIEWKVYNLVKERIEKGEYSVKFENWSFGGGRDEDRRRYTVIDKDENIVGLIELGDSLWIQYLRTNHPLCKWDNNGNDQFISKYVYTSSGTSFQSCCGGCRNNEFFYKEYSELVDMAMKRDDPEIDSKFELSNYSIDRRDLL